ncbi:hypothetical protein IAU59_004145 [Kwoniella sp. CBS 9459]
MPAQFSFPPPGWPSNTVPSSSPSSSSSSHHHHHQQQPPYSQHQQQQSRPHKSRSHQYPPDHNPYPDFAGPPSFIPPTAIPYPPYSHPPVPQPFFPSHSHPFAIPPPPPSPQHYQPPYPFVPIQHPQQQPQQQHPSYPPPFPYHPAPSTLGLQIQYPQSPYPLPQPPPLPSSQHQHQSFPRSHHPPPSPLPAHPRPTQQPRQTSAADLTAPDAAHQSPVPSYRASYGQSAPTPTRPSQSQYTAAPLYGSQSQSQFQSQSRHHQPNGTSSVPLPSNRYQPLSQAQYAPSAPPVYRHPPSHPPGQLPFFLPPPGQSTTDPSLSTPPKSQAQYTTYPSRLRTGITGLIQPEHVTGGSKERAQMLAELDGDILAGGRAGSGASTPRHDSPAPYAGGGGGRRSAAAASAMLSGRRGRVVNYAEKASDDDDDEDDDEDDDSDQDGAGSDPEDDSYGGARVIPKRGPGRPPKRDRERDSSLMIGGPEHQAAMRAGKARRRREEYERGLTYLGDRVPGERVKSEQVAGLTKHIYQSEELLEEAAERPELLVPITVDLEVPASSSDANAQGIRIKDRFLWNINEPFINPKSFAEIFCTDIGIPTRPNAEIIENLIKAQIAEAQNTLEVDVLNEDVTEDDVIWSDDEVEDIMDVDSPLTPPGDTGLTENKEIRGVSEGVDAAPEEADEQADAIDDNEGKDNTWEEADCRIIINLDVQIYTHVLRDRIEWDLSSTLPPSVFAKQYCTELGLTGEAIPLITIAIHEELLKHKKDALELELFAATHPEEQAKWERSNVIPKTNSRKGNKGLVGVWRDWYDREEFGPVLIELSFAEIASREQERVREARRVMRGLTTTKRRR